MSKKTGIELIAAERQRQVDVEGWNNLHDDDHDSMQLSGAAGCYIANAINKAHKGDPSTKKKRARFLYRYDDVWQPKIIKGGWRDGWPWSEEWDKRKKHDRLRSLVIAGALIAAEIDRLQNQQS